MTQEPIFQEVEILTASLDSLRTEHSPELVYKVNLFSKNLANRIENRDISKVFKAIRKESKNWFEDLNTDRLVNSIEALNLIRSRFSNSEYILEPDNQYKALTLIVRAYDSLVNVLKLTKRKEIINSGELVFIFRPLDKALKKYKQELKELKVYDDLTDIYDFLRKNAKSTSTPDTSMYEAPVEGAGEYYIKHYDNKQFLFKQLLNKLVKLKILKRKGGRFIVTNIIKVKDSAIKEQFNKEWKKDNKNLEKQWDLYLKGKKKLGKKKSKIFK